VTDIDGNVYQTVLIGSQLWTAENVRTTRFANGTVIPNVTDGAAWVANTTPQWCNYNNDPANDLLYGKIYNGWTVSNPNNICPTGWHAATIIEWDALINYLGGAAVAAEKLKSVSGWVFPAVAGTNSSGFNGLPGGFRDVGEGPFEELGQRARWWSSSTEPGTNSAWWVEINQNGADIQAFVSKRYGYYARCVLD
jgi:uncharacterized protein (TIGR02145 family)